MQFRFDLRKPAELERGVNKHQVWPGLIRVGIIVGSWTKTNLAGCYIEFCVFNGNLLLNQWSSQAAMGPQIGTWPRRRLLSPAEVSLLKNGMGIFRWQNGRIAGASSQPRRKQEAETGKTRSWQNLKNLRNKSCPGKSLRIKGWSMSTL